MWRFMVSLLVKTNELHIQACGYRGLFGGTNDIRVSFLVYVFNLLGRRLDYHSLFSQHFHRVLEKSTVF